MSKPQLITVQRAYRALVDAGVIRDGEQIQRITIVLDVSDRMVRLTVERAADERLLGVLVAATPHAGEEWSEPPDRPEDAVEVRAWGDPEPMYLPGRSS